MTTTWTNSAIIKVYHNYPGSFKEITYHIAGIIDDAGGTLTTNFKKILNAEVTAQTSSAAMAALTKAVVGKTVVVTYTAAAAVHTIYITVTGLM